MQFFIEVLVAGLLSGVLYSLVALGFVLIYKASGVFNFAQGAMVFFAAMFFVGFTEVLPRWTGLPVGGSAVFWLAMPLAFLCMVLLAMVTERFVLRSLVNQPPITLFMATIGLTYLVEGVAQGVWGANVRGLELGIEDMPIQWIMDATGIGVSQFDAFAAGVAGVLVTVLALAFQYTRTGRALRAVADDHQAALSIGIPLQTIWVIVWSVAGFVALVAGLIWGARNGVQFALTFTALKALPVLILGGFTSIPGAILGGLIIGSSEKLAEVYLGEFVGGGIDSWFPYVLALFVLLVRPHGLFGEKHIDRV
jgi:branched-chain amino acid transport system permease protein